MCYTTPREALLSSIFRLISVLHPVTRAAGARGRPSYHARTACIAPKSERLAVRSTADAKDRLVTVNSALPKASALDPQPVLGRVGDVSGRLYGLLVIA